MRSAGLLVFLIFCLCQAKRDIADNKNVMATEQDPLKFVEGLASEFGRESGMPWTQSGVVPPEENDPPQTRDSYNKTNSSFVPSVAKNDSEVQIAAHNGDSGLRNVQNGSGFISAGHGIPYVARENGGASLLDLRSPYDAWLAEHYDAYSADEVPDNTCQKWVVVNLDDYQFEPTMSWMGNPRVAIPAGVAAGVPEEIMNAFFRMDGNQAEDFEKWENFCKALFDVEPRGPKAPDFKAAKTQDATEEAPTEKQLEKQLFDKNQKCEEVVEELKSTQTKLGSSVVDGTKLSRKYVPSANGDEVIKCVIYVGCKLADCSLQDPTTCPKEGGVESWTHDCGSKIKITNQHGMGLDPIEDAWEEGGEDYDELLEAAGGDKRMKVIESSLRDGVTSRGEAPKELKRLWDEENFPMKLETSRFSSKLVLKITETIPKCDWIGGPPKQLSQKVPDAKITNDLHSNDGKTCFFTISVPRS